MAETTDDNMGPGDTEGNKQEENARGQGLIGKEIGNVEDDDCIIPPPREPEEQTGYDISMFLKPPTPPEPVIPSILSQNQVEEFEESLAMYDREGIGEVPLEIFEIILQYLGQMPSKGQLQDMYEELDPDGEGFINFYSYLELMARALRKLDNPETIREAFRYFDKENNGSISEKEFRFYLTNHCMKLTDQEVEDMIEQAGGEDKDRRFKYNDLVDLMTSK